MRILAVTPLTACVARTYQGGQTYEDGTPPGSCEDVAYAETTELGFSGADLAALAEGISQHTLTWTTGEQTELTLSIVSSLEAPILDSVNDETCDLLRLAVDVSLVTADGGFAEEGPAEVHSSDGKEAVLEMLRTEITGTYALPEPASQLWVTHQIPAGTGVAEAEDVATGSREPAAVW